MTAPVRDKLEQQLMGRFENLRQFHPDRREIVDVEEAAVIDFLRRHAPEGEPVRLLVQQLVERIEAARIAGRAVDLRQRLLDRLLHLRRFLQRRSSRRLMISFSRARSAIRSGSVSVRFGKYSSAVRMLWNSA